MNLSEGPLRRVWPTVTLAEVADQCLGKMLDSKKNKGRLQPYLANPNVRWFDVDTSNVKLMAFEAHEEARYGLRAGDVLICEGGEAGRAAIWDGRVPGMKFQKALHRVRPREALDARFLVHRLLADFQSGRLNDYYTGATIKHLTGQDLARYTFPLPPICEQRRIAAILDQADALRAQRRAALILTSALVPSIFHGMFGDTLTNPMGWRTVNVGTIADVQGGLQVTAERKRLPVEVPYLRVANVHRNRLDLSEIKTIRATAAEVSRCTLRAGDLLIVEGHGNPDEVGRSALWAGAIPTCVHQNHLIRVRFDCTMVDPMFACEYLNSVGGRQHLLRAGKTTSGLNTISVSNVRDAPVLLPPLALQKTFATRLEGVERVRAMHRAALAHLDALFASLQHRAFRGEL